MVAVNRINPDGAFIKKIIDLEQRLYSQETKPAGNIYISETLTTTDPETGADTIFGQLPDGSYGVQPFIGDVTPPPVATTPVATAQPGVIVVSWDGQFVAGAEQPRDFQHVNVVGYKRVSGSDTLRVIAGVIRLSTESVLVTTDIVALGETWQFALESADYNDNRASESNRTPEITMQSVMSDSGVTEALEALAAEDLRLDGVSQEAQQAAAAAQARVDALSGINLSENGSFDLPITAPLTGWPVVALSAVEANAGARSGANILRASPSASAAYAFTDYVDSAKNRVYSLEMWVKLAAIAPVGSGAVSFNINTLKLDETPDTVVIQPNLENLVASDLSTTAYTKVTANYTVPQDSMKIRFGPYVTGEGNVYLIDDFKVTDVSAVQDAQLLAQQAFNTATDAATDAGNALISADGKNRIWFTDNAPAGTLHNLGDSWFDSNNDNMLSRWNGVDTWVPALIGNSAIFPNIDAGKMTVGEINAALLKAKSIGVDKLVITSTDNLIVESDFGTGGASWQLNANRIILPTGGRYGGAALRFTGTTATNTSYNLANKVTVDADSRFRVSIWVKTDTVLTASKIRLGIKPYFGPSAQAPITLISNSVTASASTYVPGTDVYTQLHGITSALPANTTHVEFYLSMIMPNTTGFIDVSSVSVTRAADGNMVVDGAIDGKTITGALLQSHASPTTGIKIDNAGIRAYGPVPDTDPTFNLDSATGNLTATGAFLTGNTVSGIAMDDAVFLGTPGLRFFTGTGDAFLPVIFAPDSTTVGYTPGSLVVMGSELVSNSSGRTELRLKPRGGGFDLGNTYGSLSDRRVEMDADGNITVRATELILDADTSRIKGRIAVGGTSTDTTVYGTSTQSALTTGVFTVTYAAPVPSGTRKPFIQIDAATSAGVSAVTQNATSSGFKVHFTSPANNFLSFNYHSVWTM